MGSVDTESLKASEVMDPGDTGTEKERGARGPGAPGTARSESHCCTSGQEQEPCVRPGCPGSAIIKRKEAMS